MAKTAKRPATKDGINYPTMDALFAARFAENVRDLVKSGFSRTEAKRRTLACSEAWDVVIQNPDGTFRFYESDLSDVLDATPEALALALASRKGISAEMSGAALDRQTAPKKGDR